MKLSIIVPTYWSRPSAQGWRHGDLVFDHPTSLDGPDTLGRFLDSLDILDSCNFDVALVVVPTADEITDPAVARVREIIAKSRTKKEPRLLTPRSLDRITYDICPDEPQFRPLLTMDGYASVRNGCLLAARLLDADVAVLIDDDEIFELPDFLTKVTEGFGRTVDGRPVESLAGYYLNPDGDYLLKRQLPEWADDWPKYQVMDDGFRQYIGKPPRYKKTPFVFGGNLSIGRDLYMRLPFDTRVTRGEDIDYLMTSLMFGVPTVLDNELHIKHDAPPKSHPQWQQFRQDIIRFGYQRAKLRAAAKDTSGEISSVTAADMDPYPGFFLRDDLDERVEQTAKRMADFYRSQGDEEAAEESLANIRIFREASNPAGDPVSFFVDLKRSWMELMKRLEPGRINNYFE